MSSYTNINKTCDSVYANYDGMTANATSGLVPCDTAQTCNYTSFDGKTKNQVQCQCGFTPNGQPYCPLRYDETADAWKQRISFQKSNTINSCHTFRRFNCEESLSNSMKGSRWNTQMATSLLHQFYGAGDCVKKIWGDSSRIKLGFYGFVSMVLTWFLL
jgi:hypothetical protein